jgi:hypothetical protein
MEGANARRVDIAVESLRPIPMVKADLVGIEQVLNNIVGNRSMPPRSAGTRAAASSFA